MDQNQSLACKAFLKALFAPDVYFKIPILWGIQSLDGALGKKQ